jgi:hypothetical protein
MMYPASASKLGQNWRFIPYNKLTPRPVILWPLVKFFLRRK